MNRFPRHEANVLQSCNAKKDTSPPYSSSLRLHGFADRHHVVLKQRIATPRPGPGDALKLVA